MNTTHKTTGFTLIEMLVVIAIIALLTSLTTPLVSSALKKAKTAACMSNLRQAHQILMTYSADHKGRVPVDLKINNSNANWRGWYHILYMEGYIPNPYKAGNYVGNTGYSCPLSASDKISYNNSSHGYGVNMGAWDRDGAHPEWRQQVVRDGDVYQYLNYTEIENPSDFIFMADTVNLYGMEVGKEVQKARFGEDWAAIWLRHQKKANILFADGRVATLARADLENLLHTNMRPRGDKRFYGD
ncbi:prepilin-type N-terminal cleavage/methylation domain-containing protein [Kiritimatiellota bacterium B12222]|nr:prepilin-type N-terminal cleavage/methylation domain-containing protein [Kiritimatiellota bacterium B12222]